MACAVVGALLLWAAAKSGHSSAADRASTEAYEGLNTGRTAGCGDPAAADMVYAIVGEDRCCPEYEDGGYGSYVSAGVRFCTKANLTVGRCCNEPWGGGIRHLRQLVDCSSAPDVYRVLERVTNSTSNNDCKAVPGAIYEQSFTLAADQLTVCMGKP